MFKVNNKDTRATPNVSIVNFEHVIADWVASRWVNRERLLSDWSIVHFFRIF